LPLLTISEAAIASGFSIELLDSLTKGCSKSGQTRVLKAKAMDGDVYIDDRELQAYLIYLREPWPLPASGTRPRVPDAIARDVREECHQSCAICGDMNHGELAHIDPVAETSRRLGGAGRRHGRIARSARSVAWARSAVHLTRGRRVWPRSDSCV